MSQSLGMRNFLRPSTRLAPVGEAPPAITEAMIPSRIVTVLFGIARPLMVSITVTPEIAIVSGVCATDTKTLSDRTAQHTQTNAMALRNPPSVYRFTGLPKTSNRATFTNPPHPWPLPGSRSAKPISSTLLKSGFSTYD